MARIVLLTPRYSLRIVVRYGYCEGIGMSLRTSRVSVSLLGARTLPEYRIAP